jgi:hypothetical protein
MGNILQNPPIYWDVKCVKIKNENKCIFISAKFQNIIDIRIYPEKRKVFIIRKNSIHTRNLSELKNFLRDEKMYFSFHFTPFYILHVQSVSPSTSITILRTQKRKNINVFTEHIHNNGYTVINKNVKNIQQKRKFIEIALLELSYWLKDGPYKLK